MRIRQTSYLYSVLSDAALTLLRISALLTLMNIWHNASAADQADGVNGAQAASDNPASRSARAPLHIQSVIPHARLAGEGRFRWFGIPIYAAQLWVGDNGYQPSAPDAASFALDLRYDRSFEGSKVAESSIDQMRKIGRGSDAEYGPWLSQMKAIFPNVVEGSRLTGIFLPGIGARFYMDGKPIGEIADPQFSSAFFGIWLSPKTTSAPLRKQLLMHAAPSKPANNLAP
ncbi:chalcone isomerase family protein [Glaciimonas immobilis]|uniref:Chalcone isomerase domain-containing protein n=1 Tax=Glaciimonas immobilis TaxID=728004 RepID=A0A840RWV2_9BURK|nr:chalcone isomerase family protein [Glaciimonas immobilis]KAF3997329.1 hypothetical protein HAV38_14235 [Glaciimonas immobilis]MBB5202365.1 hypothetical protein [Glaciimonas immobilis]